MNCAARPAGGGRQYARPPRPCDFIVCIIEVGAQLRLEFAQAWVSDDGQVMQLGCGGLRHGNVCAVIAGEDVEWRRGRLGHCARFHHPPSHALDCEVFILEGGYAAAGLGMNAVNVIDAFE